MSTIDPTLAEPLKPAFPPPSPTAEPCESAATAALIETLKLQPHVEGGYFVETDRDPLKIPNPFPRAPTSEEDDDDDDDDDATRNASTSIYYLLTPSRPQGSFHRNKGRTVHTLHSGRGRYVIIHADEAAAAEGGEGRGKARVETFVVGRDVRSGERLQWVVEGGKYKGSFLLAAGAGEEEEAGEGKGVGEGLLISETVVPGFEFRDHDFLRPERLRELVRPEQAEELWWLLRKGEGEDAAA